MIKVFTLALIVFILTSATITEAAHRTSDDKESWGYVDVRPNAHMFWWLYCSTQDGNYLKKPLVMWLQGGPGASSTGYGNFQEIGPLTVSLEPRNTTWLQNANLLFVDNPVGSGFSYVTNDTAYVKDNNQIAQDLVTLMKAFLQKMPEFQTIPFYVFAESYGGKMAVDFVLLLNEEVKAGKISSNLKGVALGDSWISGVDSTLSWGPYLYQTSLVDASGLQQINAATQQVQEAVTQGKWSEATGHWTTAEDTVAATTNGVSFYNILNVNGDEITQKNKNLKNLKIKNPKLARLFRRHVGPFMSDPLGDLMNGPIREKLRVIPKDVIWGGQSSDVFVHLSEDFMKPVVESVDKLLNTTSLSVAVYNGQLDLIVATPGTEAWVKRLKWPGIKQFLATDRKVVSTSQAKTAAFVKSFKNLSFYWILRAGHMVPADAGETATEMLRLITGI